MASYEPVMGLEIHCQLKTNTKIFCGCSTKFGAEPNTQTCPVCLALPGALPVLNETVVKYAVMMGHALNCSVREKSVFSRKNYFYPDLPKGYQISQFDLPICENGHIDIEVDGKTKRIGITRIHMEEDAGKSTHPDGDDSSYVDLNRACTPLIEIVTEPDIRTADEAIAYVKAVRNIVLYLGICDGNMEEGSLRVDTNISLRPVGREEFGTRAELKNINSFKFIKDAIHYEIARQSDILDEGGEVIQETRLFDNQKGVTKSMRSKEEAHDYRYFPEPDLLPLVIAKGYIEDIKNNLPELPSAKKARFISEYNLPEYDAGVLTAEKAMADFYEEVLKNYDDPKKASNWIMAEFMKLLNEENISVTESKVTSKNLAGLLSLVKKGDISGKIAKDVFAEMFKSGSEAEKIVADKGLKQESDVGALEEIVQKVLDSNPDEVGRFKGGEDKLMGFFVGQCMKETRGQGNPGILNKIIKEKLK